MAERERLTIRVDKRLLERLDRFQEGEAAAVDRSAAIRILLEEALERREETSEELSEIIRFEHRQTVDAVQKELSRTIDAIVGRLTPNAHGKTQTKKERAPITGAQFRAWKERENANAKKRGKRFTWPMLERLTGIKRGTLTAWPNEEDFIIPEEHQEKLWDAGFSIPSDD